MLKRRTSFTRICFAVVLMTSVMGYAPALTVLAQTGGQDSQYFPETGHTVRDPFYDFFLQHGGVEQFGYPITDDYIDSQTGLLVQYFQKARLEWHPDNPDPYKVQLGLLGEELGKKAGPISVDQIPLANDPTCYYFDETKHKVCNSFLTYYREHGGLDMFGYPITEYVYENGLIVQYFQRARMEWRPEKPAGQRVQTAPLGQIYYDYAGLDRGRLKPQPPLGNTIVLTPQVTRLTARASVLSAITRRGGTQTGYVYVSDQLGNPVSGAAVTLVVRDPTGSQTFNLPPTAANGTTVQTFPVSQAKPGQVVVMEFYVTYGGLFTTTRTSYMMWYY